MAGASPRLTGNKRNTRPDYDEPLFFIIAVLVCPAAFVFGVVGAVVTLLRARLSGPTI